MTNTIDLETAFPDVPCPIKPFGNRVLFQMRKPKGKTTGGIILVDDTTEDKQRQEQTAKVVAIGPDAFRFASGEEWASGPTFKVGDYVRVPLHGGDNHWVPLDKDKVLFKTFKSYEVVGMIEGDPLEVTSGYLFS